MGMPIPEYASGCRAHPSPVTEGSRIGHRIGITLGAAGK